jgi:hypothetical protein
MQKITRPGPVLHVEASFFQKLRELVLQLVKETKRRPCSQCGGKLDTSHFPRKPRGLGEEEHRRFSLCCRNEGCRHRVTPPSLRFLGRKVYSAWVVITVLEFAAELGLEAAICRRTLARWREYWRERLDEAHAFMRAARGLIPPGHPPAQLPGALLPCFGFPAVSSFIPILRFFTHPV